MNKKIILLILLVIIIIGAVWFANRANTSNHISNIQAQKTKIQVSASFYPVYFFAKEIGGDRAFVKNITPAGVEPHDYEPTTQDIANIENGDLLVLNGGVEAWGNKIRDNLRETKVKIVIAGEGLYTAQIQDPHFWLSPPLAKKEVEKITEGYISIDPNNSNYYKEKENILENKLDDLNNKFKAGLKDCSSHDFVTSHAAFSYLAEQYDLIQIPISGLSPDEEPSAQKLARVVDLAKRKNVKYIFFEKLISPKLAETIAAEVGAQTLVLDPLEGISDDDSSAGKNYFTVMEDNLKNLHTALQCKN